MTKLPEHINKWVKELRSGNHAQTRGTLKRKIDENQVGYCCLGVFVEKVAGKMVKTESLKSPAEGATKWYELCDQKIPPALKAQLISMNDDGNTFDEIADYIERWYINGNDLVDKSK